MFSRPTLLLTVLPSLAFMLTAVLWMKTHSVGGEKVLIAILVSYLCGMPLGVWLGRRHGKLTPPHKPLI
jgi:ABC-type proline/glycine betaine transport system permease subunit